MIYNINKFWHYLLGRKFTFHVDHAALLYLVEKPEPEPARNWNRPVSKTGTGTGEQIGTGTGKPANPELEPEPESASKPEPAGEGFGDRAEPATGRGWKRTDGRLNHARN